MAGGLKEVKDVKAVTGMFKQTFGGKSDVKDVLGAVTVSSPEILFYQLPSIFFITILSNRYYRHSHQHVGTSINKLGVAHILLLSVDGPGVMRSNY